MFGNWHSKVSSGERTSPNHGCLLQSCWLCYRRSRGRRQSGAEKLVGEINLSICGFRIKYLLLCLFQFSSLNERFFGILLNRSRVRAQFMWNSKPTIVLTDKKLVTNFFQKNSLPSWLWNPFNHVLQLQFKIVYNAALFRTPAYFLSRLKIIVTEKIPLKVREDIRTTSFEVTKSPSDVTKGEYFFST